jgi:hypothetical protein
MAARYEPYETMSDPMKPEFTAVNPIVAAATKIRARREIERAAEVASTGTPRKPEDAEESLRLMVEYFKVGLRRVNAILGERTGVKLISLERPLRLRLRFGEERVALDLDEVAQLVRIRGLDLDGEYQFDTSSEVPSLINLSKISTEAGYGDAVTASSLLRRIAQNAELPPPAHLLSPGPLQFSLESPGSDTSD